MSFPKCLSKIPLYYGGGGMPSSFQGVTEWGTPWPGPYQWAPMGEDREQRRGEACPPARAV